MICAELINRKCATAKIDFKRFDDLSFERKRLISNWYEKAWDLHNCTDSKRFEAFIFAWIAFNGWASCISDLDMDCEYLNSLTQDQSICQKFSQLVAVTGSPLAIHATLFHQSWPIFKVQEIRKLRKRRLLTRYFHTREERKEYYLASKDVRLFAPACYKRHRNAQEQIPLDWPHTLAALYRVRCNLFHGDKALDSEVDEQIVSNAFLTLVYFLREAQYL